MSALQNHLSPFVISEIAAKLQIPKGQVDSTLKLIADDCTVPFIARYRKEATGSLNEVQIRDIRDEFEYLISLNERKDTIVKSIEEQGKMTDELRNKIINCKVKSE